MKRLLLLVFLLCSSPCWAQPSTGYAYATPDAPGTDGETGYTFIVDLSDMPASWWSTAENTDGTRGRVYRNDGTTRLAVDWIDYDDTTETGFIRFKDDMALSPTTYRIYPPVSGNATVLSTDTYGRENAYDSTSQGYWPLTNLNDRTSNGRNLTATGSPTSGATGKIGDCYTFNGSTQSLDYASSPVSAYPVTLIGWFSAETYTADQVITALGDTDNTAQLRLYFNDPADVLSTYSQRLAQTSVLSGSTTIGNTNWRHAAGVWTTSTSRAVYLNGASEDTDTATVDWPAVDNLTIGRLSTSSSPSLYFDGSIDGVQVHSAARSAEWIIEEYKQTNDNTAYWNTWTWNAASATGDPNPLTPTLPGGTPDPLKRILP